MLTQEFAASRAKSVTLTAQHVHVDLSDAKNPERDVFYVCSVLALSTTTPTVHIDLANGSEVVVKLDGKAVPFSYQDETVTIPNPTIIMLRDKT